MKSAIYSYLHKILARSPMADFLRDCYFNGFSKGIKYFVSTPRYAKKLRAMRHSTELRLRAMPHSAELQLQLRAMTHRAELRLKSNFSPDYESMFKTALDHESDDPVVRFN
jgi:hypothetical protein